MRQVIPYLLLTILLSSCYTTHVSIILNEPAFERAGQVTVLSSIDKGNPELHAGVATSKNWGVVAGTYRGWRGAQIYDFGINYFKPTSSNLSKWVSITLGATVGKNVRNSGYVVPSFGYGFYRGATTNSTFASTYFQSSYRFKNKEGNKEKNFNIIFKYEFLYFTDFESYTHQSTSVRQNSYEIKQTIKNKEAHFLKLGFLHSLNKDNRKLYLQLQYGIDWVFGFKIKGIERVSGYYTWQENEKNKNIVHPKVFPLFLNIALGIKI